MANRKKIVLYTPLIIIGIYFLILGLIEAQGFLIPLVTAIILSLMILPLARKMEKGKLKRSSISLLSSIFLFLLSLGIGAIVVVQVQSFSKDWPQIQEKMRPKLEKAQNYIVQHTPLKKENLEITTATSSGQQGGNSNSVQKKMAQVLTKIIGFLGNYILTFIYIFFLLNYRNHFKQFLFRVFSEEKKNKVRHTLKESTQMAPRYLWGKLVLMGILAVLYAIGLGISGVDNFILVSVLASLLSLIPYIGNIIAVGIAIVLGYITSGETMVLIGILITFGIAQFVESYLLEPYVVGDKVNLHPFFVILFVVLGNMIWGIMGMILAIPIMAIFTVIMLNISFLEPLGYLFSDKKSKNE